MDNTSTTVNNSDEEIPPPHTGTRTRKGKVVVLVDPDHKNLKKRGWRDCDENEPQDPDDTVKAVETHDNDIKVILGNLVKRVADVEGLCQHIFTKVSSHEERLVNLEQQVKGMSIASARVGRGTPGPSPTMPRGRGGDTPIPPPREIGALTLHGRGRGRSSTTRPVSPTVGVGGGVLPTGEDEPDSSGADQWDDIW